MARGKVWGITGIKCTGCGRVFDLSVPDAQVAWYGEHDQGESCDGHVLANRGA